MDTEIQYQKGGIIRGTVVRHAPYGAWVKIDESAEGLLLIGNMRDEDGALSERDFPDIDSKISAIIIHSAITDGVPKIALSTRESDMTPSCAQSGG